MPGRWVRFKAWSRRALTILGKLVPALIVVGAVLALLKADPSRRVDYVKALTWPLVAALGYLALRELIHERFRHMSRISVGGVADIDFDAQNALLEREARKAVEAAAAPEGDPGEQQSVPPVPALGEPKDVEVQMAEMQREQEAVERAIKAGAKWGYSVASQYAEPPEPIIEWDEDGQPSIVRANGRRRSDPPPSQRGYSGAWAARYSVPRETVVADAEEEVRRCAREYFAAKKGPLGGMVGMLPELDLLEAAKKRLARIDPSNHLLL